MSEQSKLRKTVGEILSSPTRHKLVVEIDEKSRVFSELQRLSKLSSGNLGYHLLKAQASGVIEKDKQEKYSITPLGSRVARALKQIEEALEKV